MIELIDEIPEKKPVRQLLQGEVCEYMNTLAVGEVILPKTLAHKLRRSQGTYSTLQAAVDNKPMHLLGKERGSGVEWFGLVSDQFQPISVKEVSDLLGDISHKRFIRYDHAHERYQVGYALIEGDATVMVTLDSGAYGAYGGNGQSALKHFVAVTENNPLQWTLFRPQRQKTRGARAIHRDAHPPIDDVVQEQMTYASRVHDIWTTQQQQTYTREDIHSFAQEYLSTCGRIFDTIMATMDKNIAAKDLISRLHAEAARRCSATRFGIEALAGDLVMYHHNREVM